MPAEHNTPDVPQLAAANFWAEIDNVNSPYRPYLDALPAPDEAMCPLVSMPREYFHLMQSDAAVSDRGRQVGIEMTCRAASVGLLLHGISVELVPQRCYMGTGELHRPQSYDVHNQPTKNEMAAAHSTAPVRGQPLSLLAAVLQCTMRNAASALDP